MMIASQHFTVPHPAVMPTKPASKPLQKPGTSKALGATRNRRSMKTTKPPTQGAKVVLAATRPWATYTSTQPLQPTPTKSHVFAHQACTQLIRPFECARCMEIRLLSERHPAHASAMCCQD
eukprot:1065916-Amphidinium_carterae.1